MTLKVINDSDFFVAYKKGKKVESAAQVTEIDERISREYQTEPEQAHACQNKNDDTQEKKQSKVPQEETDKICLRIYKNVLENISELSDDQRSKYKKLVTEFSDVFRSMILI